MRVVEYGHYTDFFPAGKNKVVITLRVMKIALPS
jgi:hypothetical protein